MRRAKLPGEHLASLYTAWTLRVLHRSSPPRTKNQRHRERAMRQRLLAAWGRRQRDQHGVAGVEYRERHVPVPTIAQLERMDLVRAEAAKERAARAEGTE